MLAVPLSLSVNVHSMLGNLLLLRGWVMMVCQCCNRGHASCMLTIHTDRALTSFGADSGSALVPNPTELLPQSRYESLPVGLCPRKFRIANDLHLC